MQPKFNLFREKTNTLTYKNHKNDFCNFQFHSQIEIYVVTEGEMIMLVDGNRKTLKAGELSVALSYVGHDYRTPQSSRSFSIIIPTYLCEEFLESINGQKLKNPFFDEKELFDTIKMYYSILQDENASLIRKHGIVNVILGLIFEKGEFIDCNSPTNNKLISKILLYLNDNFKKDISPLSVAEYFGYSQCYISRYFKACIGINLVKYITILRLKNALILMHDHDHDVTYCALESGFSSMRTFYRSFKNEFACSPKVYLDKMK